MTSPLDLLGPFHGPCGLCGGPDARHREADAITSRIQAGENPATVAEDYGLTTTAARTLANSYCEDETDGGGADSDRDERSI